MIRKKVVACAGLVLGLIGPWQAANATAILVGQWYTFGFDGVGSSLTSGSGVSIGFNPPSIAAPNPAWTFTLASAGSVIFSDGFNSGDQFTISDFGSSIGTTSLPVPGANCGGDITVCLNTSATSKGTFALAAGAHSLTGIATLSPFGGGAGFFRVSAGAGSVPEPSSWALMLAGFGAIGYALRSRKVTIRTI